MIAYRKVGDSHNERIAQLEAQLAADQARTPTRGGSKLKRGKLKRDSTPIKAADLDDERTQELFAPEAMHEHNVRQKEIVMELKKVVAEAQRARSKMLPPNAGGGGGGGEAGKSVTAVE